MIARLICVALLAVATAHAQNFPQRPVRIIVAFTSGTAADIVARQLAEKMTASLGKQVVVENRDGASGTIGAGIAAHATPDGHTMLIASTSIVVSPLLIKNLSYDVFRDFAPVASIATFPTVLVAGTQIAASTPSELIAYAKANPRKLDYGTAGRGSASHLSAELMRSMANIEIVEVPYRVTAQALADTISGQVAIYFPNLAAALPNIKAGRLKALAVTSDKRTRAAPDIPTMAETLPGYEAASWYGLIVPSRTPKAVVATLNAHVVKALQLPDVQQRFLNLGGDIASGSPDELARTMKNGAQKWGKLVREIEAQGR